MSTLVLSAAEVSRHLNALWLLADSRDAFVLRAGEARSGGAPPGEPLQAQGTALTLGAGRLPGVPVYSVRVHTPFLGEPAPAAGFIHLNDLQTGAPRAVMDAGPLMAVGAAVVGALGADVLSRRESSRVALLGVDEHSPVRLKCLRLVRSLAHVRVYDADPERSAAFAFRMFTELSLPVRAAGSVQEAVYDADLVVAPAVGEEGALKAGLLPPGCHLHVPGAELQGPSLLAASLADELTWVCDQRGNVLRSGALGKAGLAGAALATELGEVLTQLTPGRTSEAQRTALVTTNPPFLELAAAWHVLQSASGDTTLRRVELGA